MTIEAFRRHMSSNGCDPHPSAAVVIQDDDKIHRFRLAHDKPGKMSGAYRLKEEADGFWVGWVKDWVSGESFGFHTASTRKHSDAEKARFAGLRAQSKAAAEARQAAEYEAARVRAVKLWSVCSEDTEGNEYLGRKKVDGGPARVSRGLLVVPVHKAGVLVGLQYIAPDGTKRFMKDTEKRGGYCEIAGRAGCVYVCEGFATGMSIHAATGCTVVVAFDADNLKPVAMGVSDLHKGARVVIANDEDWFTFDPKKVKAGDVRRMTDRASPEWDDFRRDGLLVNKGRDAAMQAAVAIGAQCIGPDRHGDWNDVHVEDGLDAVRNALEALPVIEQEYPEYDYSEPYEDAGSGGTMRDILAREIRPQGYIGKKYYFFPRTTGDIEEMMTSDLKSDLNLYHLARRSFYEQFFQEPKDAAGKTLISTVSPILMEMCKDKGKFDADRVRSVGVWRDDDGTVVANLGGGLYIPGRGFMDHSEYDSDSVYVSAPKTVNIDIDPLTSAEAVKLRYVCESLRWKNDINGSLLAGWIYAAVLSGLLRWRPHIFITGQKGSGKTTVIQRIVRQVLAGWSVNEDGGTTEAGFRRKLGNRARPVVSDEMESENEQQQRLMDQIFYMARKSSSGAEYSNAYVDITIHSSFCFGAINPNIKAGADQDRITVMELIPDNTEGARQRWKAVERQLRDVVTKDFGRALIRRAIDNADVYLKNVEVFEDELAEILGSARSAEQFAPMVAGLYALHSTNEITADRARDWVKQQDWEFFKDADEGSDSEKLVAHLMTSLVEWQIGDRNTKATVASLIAHVQNKGLNEVSAKDALARHGMKVEDDVLLVANSKSRIGELLKDTAWRVPKNTLLRYPGAEKGDKPVWFGAGVVSRCIRIPIVGLIDGLDADSVADNEQPF